MLEAYGERARASLEPDERDAQEAEAFAEQLEARESAVSDLCSTLETAIGTGDLHEAQAELQRIRSARELSSADELFGTWRGIANACGLGSESAPDASRLEVRARRGQRAPPETRP